MPSVSQAQSRLMHMAVNPKSRRRMSHPPSLEVAREFVAADEGRKVGKLPEHVKPGRAKPN
jgi:hypothetical protein